MDRNNSQRKASASGTATKVHGPVPSQGPAPGSLLDIGKSVPANDLVALATDPNSVPPERHFEAAIGAIHDFDARFQGRSPQS